MDARQALLMAGIAEAVAEHWRAIAAEIGLLDELGDKALEAVKEGQTHEEYLRTQETWAAADAAVVAAVEGGCEVGFVARVAGIDVDRVRLLAGLPAKKEDTAGGADRSGHAPPAWLIRFRRVLASPRTGRR